MSPSLPHPSLALLLQLPDMEARYHIAMMFAGTEALFACRRAVCNGNLESAIVLTATVLTENNNQPQLTTWTSAPCALRRRQAFQRPASFFSSAAQATPQNMRRRQLHGVPNGLWLGPACRPSITGRNPQGSDSDAQEYSGYVDVTVSAKRTVAGYDTRTS